jgi:hypothetical protein
MESIQMNGELARLNLEMLPHRDSKRLRLVPK